MSDFAAPPPAIYDHEPKEYYRVARLPATEVKRVCGGIERACAIPKKRVIAIDKSIAGELLDRILRHEKGHLNGWKH
jgi:hypothetical protein